MLERVGGLGAEHDWPNALTPAEQQRLAFARLLLSKPAYAILDHITDALRPDEISPLLAKLNAVSIAYICFAEDHELIADHDAALEIAEDGGHKVIPTRGPSS